VSVFVDTSALLAVIDAKDRHNVHAMRVWKSILLDQRLLVCTNYVLVEALTLAQSRLGLEAARTLQEDIFPLVSIEWVDEVSHRAGVTGVFTAARKKLSLVDCVSFDIMRRLGIKTVFTFDRHFKEQGFTCLP